MEGNEIREIDAYQLTTETHWQIRGNIFIDCTGNATLGYYAGAEYRTGSEGRAEFNEPDAPTMTVWEIRCYSRRWTEDIR